MLRHLSLSVAALQSLFERLTPDDGNPVAARLMGVAG